MRTSRSFLASAAAMIIASAMALATPIISFAESQAEVKLSPIQIPPARQQLIGVKFATVKEADLRDTVSATGTVETDEQLSSYVQTRYSGWIRRVYADQTYQYVKQGDPLFTIYSPDLVSAENEYLLAVRENKTLAKSSVDGVSSGADSMVSASLARLRFFGVPPREINRLEREGKARDEIDIVSPASGYIVDRQAFPNMYAEPSMRLFTITNLSQVWVYAAVFQDQIAEIKKGDPVEVSLDSFPGRTIAGNVDSIWAAMDPMTRTAKVRCNLPNPDGELKVGMFLNVAIKPKLGRGLVIPESSVLQTGLRNIAFVDRGEGYLEPREVELGQHLAGQFVVRKGLHEGERVVNSANFLVDSESQLQAAIGAYAPPPPGVSASGQPAAPAATIEMKTEPNPPQKGKNHVTVAIRDATGKPISGATVSVVFFMPAMPAMGMAAMRSAVNATDQGDGKYVASVTLDSGGTWQASASASKDGNQIATMQTNVSVAGSM